MKIFIALGSLLVLVLSVVLVAPLFIDWTAFRADFEREASRILGQPVRVLGEAEARLLPFPSLTFTQVVVGETDAEPVMTLDRFRMDAELAPYLSGEIRIFQMSLERPHLRVPIGAGEPGLVAPTSAGSTVVLEDVSISDGRVSLINAETGRSREFTGIDAQISAQTLSGPFAGTGQLAAIGEPMSFSLSSGRIEEGGRWPLRLTLGSQRIGVDFTFDGETILGDGEPDFAGRFDLASRPVEEGEVRPLPPVQLGSRIEIGRREALLSEIRAEVGLRENPYVLTGEGSFDVGDIPHFDLTLRGEQIDVDRLAGETTGSGETPTFADRADAVRATLVAIPRIDIPGRVDLTLPIVTAGDTTIRNIRFSGSPTEQGWTIRDLRAELPGQTLLEASGVLDVRERFAFAGDVLVAARQPGRFAEWMTGRTSPELARLNRAGFEASVRVSQDEQSMEGLEVDVGGQRLTGRLQRASHQDLRSVSADLEGEAVDLDAFLAFARLFTEGSTMLEPVQALDVRFEAGPVAYDGITADQLSLDFSYADDLLDLRHAIARGVAGADVDARGFVAQLSADPQPELFAEISTEAPERLAALIAGRLPRLALTQAVERASEWGPLALTATVSSPTEVETPSIELTIEGTAGETAVDLSVAIENGVHAFERGGRYGLEARLSSEEAGALLRQFGAQGLDLGLASPLTADVKLSGEGSGPVSVDARAVAPGSRLSFDGSFLSGGDATAGNLALHATSDDASLWLTAAGASIGQGLDALPLDLRGALSFADGGWTLADIEGSLAGTSLQASLFGAAGEPTRGRLRLGELSMPWLATLTYGVPPDLPAASGLWPQEPFAEPLPALGGISLELEVDRLDLGDLPGLDAVSARLEGEGGSLRFENLAATLDGGQMAGSVEMGNAGGFGSLRVDLSLEDARLAADALAAPAGLSGRISVKGSGRSYTEIAASLTGEGEARLADVQLRGVPSESLTAVLAAADGDGFEATSHVVSEVVSTLSESARFAVGEATVPVAVAVGVARFLPVTVEGRGESLTGSGALDLRTGEASGTLDLAFRPGEDDRIDDAAPAMSYRLDAAASNWELASVEALTSFVSVRAYQREQERLEALREELRETVRLRREARLYRWRETERARIAAQEQAALEAERLRLEAEAAERAQAERAEAERAAALEAERQAEEEARRAAETAPAPPVLTAPELPVPPFELPPPPQGFQGLPGVEPLPSF